MKISELISTLKNLMDEHGDVEVRFECQEIWAEDINYEKEDTYFGLPERIEIR